MAQPLQRKQAAGLAIAALVLVALLGWLVGSRTRSPAEVAAETAPPDATPILVPAEERVLSTDVVIRGTGRFGSPQSLVLAPTELKSLPPVVTSQPAAGSQAAEGDVLLTVSGRPVFLLEGDQPSYRDLGPGMSGNDVRQLQSALGRLGLLTGPIDSTYGSTTETAVQRLYTRAGFDPVAATDDQLTEVRTVDAALIPGGRASAGVQVPADEIVFVAEAPVRISELTYVPGEQVEGSFMTVTGADIAIDSSLPLEEAGLVRAGMAVVIDEPDLGIDTTGVVSRVAEGPGTDGVDGFHVYLEIQADEPLPSLVNASVRLTIPVESTSDLVLAVPVTALTLAPDGSSRVQREVDGAFEFVTVDPGLAADGYVQVTPVDGTLSPGDLVVIGFEAGGDEGSDGA